MRRLPVFLTAALGLGFAGDDPAPVRQTVDPLADAPRPVTCTDGTFQLSRGNSLVVRSLAVVNHRDAEGTGPWALGGLMSALTPSGYPGGAPGFMRDWLAEWERDVPVNGVATPKVTNIRDKLLDPWPRAGGGLDLAQTPFRLLAIVNRIDRYDLAAGRAGELRFVYSVIESNQRFPGRQLPMNFTVIVELAVPGTTLADVEALARRWAALSELRVDSAEFHDRLRALTDPIVTRANLRAVRSNEVTLDDPWDLRHFELGPGPESGLHLAPLAMTPMIRRNRSAALTAWILDPARRADLLLGKHRLPAGLRGNYAPMTMVREGADSFRWETDGSGPPTDAANDARHAFSLFTCSGCHSGETATNAVHIVPRRKDEIAQFSAYMTGETIDDIVRPRQQRTFDDLGRRERALNRLVCGRDAADEDRSFDE